MTSTDHDLPARPPAPPGWYRLAWADEVTPSGVHPCDAFDNELVIYRLGTGEPRLIDPFCPHMGSHLGHGGCVEGDHIVCPFHGWHWDEDGKNVEIPYSHGLSRRTVRHHEVRDAAGALWGWLADQDASAFPTDVDRRSDQRGRTWSISTPLTSVLDALADGPFLSRLLEVRIDETDVLQRPGSCRIVHRNGSTQAITIELVGPGIAVLRFAGTDGVLVQTHTERTDGVLELSLLADTSTVGEAWSRLLDCAAPLLDRARVVEDLEDLPTEVPIGAVRAWHAKFVGH